MANSDRDTPLILVVEDDPDASQIAEHMLIGLGCHAVVASNAMEGLFLLREGRPDLVLLDISLPDMDGVEFLDAAARMPDAKGVPFIVASAIYGADSAMTRALRERGVLRYLSKPFSSRQLEQALRQILRGWEPQRPEDDLDAAVTSFSEGGTLEIDIGELAIRSLTGMRAVPEDDAEDDSEDEEIVVEDPDLDNNIGELIGPLHASVIRDEGRLDAEVIRLAEDAVSIQTTQIQPRPGDLLRLELRARMVGFDQQIHHVSVLLLTRVGNVQRRGVAWEIGLAVQAAKPDDLWPKIGEVWRPV